MKTRKIAGHTITLDAGKRYRASRPFASRKGERFTVSIQELPGGFYAQADATVPGLSYAAANALITRFNNGLTSFDGRIW